MILAVAPIRLFRTCVILIARKEKHIIKKYTKFSSHRKIDRALGRRERDRESNYVSKDRNAHTHSPMRLYIQPVGHLH